MWWLRYNYRNQRAVDKSNDTFLKTIADGGKEQLEILYGKISQAIPQALKTKI